MDAGGSGSLQGADPPEIRRRRQSVLRHRAAVGRRHHRASGYAPRAISRSLRLSQRADPRHQIRRVPDVSGLSGIVAPIMSWSGWTSFSLVPATASSHDLFGVGEYLASLALFLVVMTISDFRY